MAWPSLGARTKDWGNEVLTDSDLEGQFDLLWTYINDMMNSTTGHKHNGTTAHSQKVPVDSGLTIASQATGDVYYASSATANTRLGIGTSGQVLTVSGGLPAWVTPTTVTPAFENYLLHVREEEAANTAGGTFTSGAWRTRVLNTSKTNQISGASLASNQITLPAGTYHIEASAPAYVCNEHKAKLYNITDSADVLIGTSERTDSAGAVVTQSRVRGRFVIAAQKVFELQHQCTTTRATNGLGIPSNFSVVEVYAEVMIWKVA